MTTSYLRSSEPKHDFIFYALLLTISLLVCCSCSSTKQVTQVVEHVSKDTVYLSTLQYDSIYIFESHSSDYHPAIFEQDESFAQRSSLDARPKTDTVFIKDVSVEYRYKLLRDTTRIIQRDSIPYEVTIIETNEITRPLTPFDRLCRTCFWVLSGTLFVLSLKFVLRLKHLKR